MPPTILRPNPLLNPQQGGTVQAPSVLSVLLPGASLWSGAVETPIPAVFEAAFAGSGYAITAELYRATIDNQLVEDVSAYLVDGEVSMNLDRDIKLALSVTLRNPGVVTPYEDFLAPFVRIVFDDGRPSVYQQVGLYATRVAPGSYGPTDAGATYACDDLTRVLADYVYTDFSDSNAGTTYLGQVKGTIQNGGIARHNIPDTSATLPTAQTWPIGTSRLEKANTLLDQLGWYHLGMDLDGKISTPGAPQNLASREPWRTLTDTDVMSLLDVTYPGQEIANVVLAINDDASAAPLSSVARNDDPSSPTSTVSVGRTIMRLVKVGGSTTQTVLDALAARYLAESRSFYRVVKLTILHDPTVLVLHQSVRLSLTGTWAALNGLWWVRAATMGLTPDKSTVLEINQLTSDIDGVQI